VSLAVPLALALVAATPAHGTHPRFAFRASELTLTSTAFRAGRGIPTKHTCEGEDLSPPLAWRDRALLSNGGPVGVKSFALIVDDPDAPDPRAPKTIWVHWVLYDLPPDVSALPEGVRAGHAPKGARDGLNDWKQPGWRGPCPPVGRHRYFFKLYALDRTLGPLRTPTRAALEAAMQGHVLAHATLMGTYEKTR